MRISAPGQLAQLYWQLRACRPGSRPGKKTIYRRIARERMRLAAEGVPQIELHLWCRYLTNPRNPMAAIRLSRYLAGESERF